MPRHELAGVAFWGPLSEHSLQFIFAPEHELEVLGLVDLHLQRKLRPHKLHHAENFGQGVPPCLSQLSQTRIAIAVALTGLVRGKHYKSTCYRCLEVL